MNNSYKKASFLFLGLHCSCILCLFIIFALMAFSFDPLHIFTAPHDPKAALFSTDQRIQNAGYIKSFDFDSVIIGNSHMENLSHSKTADYLPGKWFNLSMSGSRNNERKIVLEKAFREKELKQVLLLLTGDLQYNPTEGFDFLYDRNPFNDIFIYLNQMYSECFVKHTINTIFKTSYDDNCFGQKLNIDEHNAWIYYPDHNSRFGGIEKWAQHYQNGQLIGTYNDVNKYYQYSPRPLKKLSYSTRKEIENNINDNIVSLVKAHPETVFYCYAQPYFKLLYALDLRDSNGQAIEIYSEFLRVAAKVTSKYPNFKLYGFDNLAFASDVKNYKDLTHFSREMNYQILEYIKEGEYSLDMNNIDEYIDNFIKGCYSFDIKSFHNDLNALIERENYPTSS